MRRLFCALPLLVISLAVAAPAGAEPAVVRSACLVPCDPGPDIEVHYRVPLTYMASGTETIDFGSTPVGTPVPYDNFAIGATEALGDLTISSITVPAGFTYVFGPNISPTVEAAGASHMTKIECDADAPGTYTGNLVITSNDPDEGTFTIALTCTVDDPTASTTESTTEPTAAPTTGDQGGEENSIPTTGGEGSGAGLPTTGSSALQSILLGLGLLLVGGSAGLLARRRA